MTVERIADLVADYIADGDVQLNARAAAEDIARTIVAELRVYVVVERNMDPLDLDVIGVYFSAAEAEAAGDEIECSEDGDCDVFTFGPMPVR